jgi:hypothetical protein
LEKLDSLIPNAKEFSVAFACAVTKPTRDQDSCIAKNGEESVFALMHRVFPMVSFFVTPSQKVNHPQNLTSEKTTSIQKSSPNKMKILQVCHREPRRNREKWKISRSEFNKLIIAECSFKSDRIRRKALSRLFLRIIVFNFPISLLIDDVQHCWQLVVQRPMLA